MMNRIITKIISFSLITAIFVSLCPEDVFAKNVAGVTSDLFGASFMEKEVTTPLSGVSLMLSDTLGETQSVTAVSDIPILVGDLSQEGVAISTEFVEPEKPQIDYASTAVSLADDYVNVRSEPSENSSPVGKLYSECVGTVIGQEGDWTKISSGSVEGYVRNDYLSIGNQEEIDGAIQYHAKVTADALKLRSEMNTDCKVYSVARNGVKLDVLDDSTFNDGWIYIKKGDTEAYVSSEYVDMVYEFDYAESKEEEFARRALESESRGMEVANYALQFVGNPYVWGGTSLTRGADCSGFVMSVYAKFGIYLPHSSAADRNVGYGVKISDMQPGDLVCYSGHVALCIGNGMIVHAASRRSGIKVSSAYYRKILCVRRVL